MNQMDQETRELMGKLLMGNWQKEVFNVFTFHSRHSRDDATIRWERQKAREGEPKEKSRDISLKVGYQVIEKPIPTKDLVIEGEFKLKG